MDAVEETLTVPVRMEIIISDLAVLKEFREFCTKHALTPLVYTSRTSPENLSRQLRKPRAAFKDLCGAAWLNPKGMIDEYTVYTFLNYYVKAFGLRQGDGYIVLPEEMQDALDVKYKKIFEDELISLVERAFV